MVDVQKNSPRVTIQSAKNLSLDKKDIFIKEVLEVEKSAWPPELRASKEKFVSRLEMFPDGFFVAQINGKIKGVTTSQVTHYPSSTKTWDEITDNGFIAKTHDPNKNALYVVSIGVAADTQRVGLGGMLLEAQKNLAFHRNLKCLFLGARVPGYDKYCKEHGEISIEEYLRLKNKQNESIDPEVRFYERKGFGIVKIVANFEPDKESRNYGVIMVWGNPEKAILK